jgi:hypothetical protein
MKPARVISGIAVAVATALSLTGCAFVTGWVPPELGRKPTADERVLIEAFSTPAVIAAARAEGFACPRVAFAMSDMPNDALLTSARWSGDPCEFWIQVSPNRLRQEAAIELAGTFVHELGHVAHRDWSQRRAPIPQIQREREADAFSLRVLNRLGPAWCQARIEYWKRIRENNISDDGRRAANDSRNAPLFLGSYQAV